MACALKFFICVIYERKYIKKKLNNQPSSVIIRQEEVCRLFRDNILLHFSEC